jgi:hypothetical protein
MVYPLSTAPQRGPFPVAAEDQCGLPPENADRNLVATTITGIDQQTNGVKLYEENEDNVDTYHFHHTNQQAKSFIHTSDIPKNKKLRKSSFWLIVVCLCH